jgi:hypothetical protein
LNCGIEKRPLNKMRTGSESHCMYLNLFFTFSTIYMYHFGQLS